MLLIPSICLADYVNGYYRSNGTYVEGYERSSPDEYKWNNNGPSEYTGQAPSARDNDHDGIPNMRDHDDDNDGVSDDRDKNQYSGSGGLGRIGE